MDALPASYVDQRRCDLAEQSFHEARELDPASRARLHERRLLVGTGLVGDVWICAPLWAVSVFDSDRRNPRSASTSARIERRIWSGKVRLVADLESRCCRFSHPCRQAGE